MALPDLPVETRPDPDAVPGDFIPLLARLLLALARRRLAARESPGEEVRISDESEV